MRVVLHRDCMHAMFAHANKPLVHGGFKEVSGDILAVEYDRKIHLISATPRRIGVRGSVETRWTAHEEEIIDKDKRRISGIAKEYGIKDVDYSHYHSHPNEAEPGFHDRQMYKKVYAGRFAKHGENSFYARLPHAILNPFKNNITLFRYSREDVPLYESESVYGDGWVMRKVEYITDDELPRGEREHLERFKRRIAEIKKDDD